MENWEVLTPEEGPGEHKTVSYRFQKEGPFPHWVYLENGSVHTLSNAELDALAAKSSQVQALVEAVQELLTEAAEVDYGLDEVPVELWDAVARNLKPFEATDA